MKERKKKKGREREGRKERRKEGIEEQNESYKFAVFVVFFSCEIIKDAVSQESLLYAFIEYENVR